MNRINPNHNTYTHQEAVRWLRDFMADLKRMVYLDANYQPFTMVRLEEWSKHRADIETCGSFESSMMKRLSDMFIPEHQDAISCFNRLVIDLKLLVSGIEHDAITEARISEADKYYAEISQCKKRRTIFY